MKQFVVETTEGQVLPVIGLYDKDDKLTDDLLKTESISFRAPDGSQFVAPYCYGGVFVLQ